MTYFQTIVKNVKEFWSEINAATLTGAIDVLVIEQEDGTFLSSPFHVRFGKLGVLKSKEKIVDIEINGESVNIFMKLDDSGAAYFVEEVDEDVEWQTDYVATSPIPDQSHINWGDRRKGSLAPTQLEHRFHSGNPSGNNGSGTPLVENKSFFSKSNTSATYTTAEVQTDPPTVLFSLGQPEDGDLEAPLAEPDTGRKGKLNRKKRRRRSYMKHSRNGSKTNMKDIVEQSEQDGMFLMEDVNDADQEDHDDDHEGPDSLEMTSWSQDDQVVPEAILDPLVNPIPHTMSAQFADSFNFDGLNPELELQLDQNPPSGSPTPTTQSESLPGGLARTDSSDNETNIGLDDTDTKILNDSLIGSRVMGLSRCTSETDYLNAIIQGDISVEGLGYSNVEELRSKSVAPGFHYFSDQEEGSSPMTSRPSSPVLSDSEFEKKVKDDVPAWKWGELPSPISHHSHNIVSQVSEKNKEKNGEDDRSRKSSWWSWGDKRKGSETPGIRLDDLTKGGQVDPELAAIYLSPNNVKAEHADEVCVKVEPEDEAVENNDDPLDVSNYDGIPLGIDILQDEDAESGRGPSLPMSPHGVSGAIGGPCPPRMDHFSSTSEAEDDSLPALIGRHFPDFGISFCGPLSGSKSERRDSISPEVFAEHQLSYSDFASKLGEDPSLLSSENLVVRLQERYMTWQMASPIIVSVLAFKISLPQDLTHQLTKESFAVNMSKTPEDLIQENKEQIDNRKEKSSSWLSGWWGAKEQEEKVDKDGIKTEGGEDIVDNVVEEGGEAARQDIATQTCDPIGYPRKKRPDLENSTGSSENDSDESGMGRKPERKFRKTLRLTPDMIKELNLRSGSNEIQFSVTTAFQGTTKCKCHIFMWKHNSKIVISDIDGTITKSDVLGHILPVIGKDWAQSGVAQLFNKIKNNGYHIMYLSARAIGQATVTKEYLQSVRQGDLTLPDGPLFLNPESLIQCFRTEVIERNPEEFKIACLRDIQNLFGGKNPFFAGYGNRTNDAYAYRAVGIPISRIFTINPAGELRHELTQNFQTSYLGMSLECDNYYPVLDNALQMHIDVSESKQRKQSIYIEIPEDRRSRHHSKQEEVIRSRHQSNQDDDEFAEMNAQTSQLASSVFETHRNRNDSEGADLEPQRRRRSGTFIAEAAMHRYMKMRQASATSDYYSDREEVHHMEGYGDLEEL